MVVIPRLHGKRYCPVRCMLQYLKLRTNIVQNEEISNNLPLLLTEHLWSPGSYKADKTQPGFYTKARFSRDNTAAIKMLAEHIPSVVAFTETLKVHSLRAGIPTEMQRFKNVPQELQRSIGNHPGKLTNKYFCYFFF